jgi:hypothetical protein
MFEEFVPALEDIFAHLFCVAVWSLKLNVMFTEEFEKGWVLLKEIRT